MLYVTVLLVVVLGGPLWSQAAAVVSNVVAEQVAWDQVRITYDPMYTTPAALHRLVGSAVGVVGSISAVVDQVLGGLSCRLFDHVF